MSEQELYMMSEEKAKVRSQEGVVRVWRSVWVQNLVLWFRFLSRMVSITDCFCSSLRRHTW